MSIVITKGSSFSGFYSAPDIGVFEDWAGSVAIYTSYPAGQVKLSAPLVFDSITKRLNFALSVADVDALDTGMLYFVSSIFSDESGISVEKIDYVTVVSASVTSVPMTTLTMTIAKIDGTPAGKETRTLTNTVDGAVVTLGWDGVQVTASHPVADEISGAIIGTETISTKTNAAGYAQLAVIKGSTVTVSCPSFGKTVEVNTTGLDTIDLSTHF